MSEQDYSIIEAYLEGGLSPEDALAVERRATAEPLFFKALAERRRLYEHLRAEAGESDLRKNLTSLGDKYFVEKPREATVKRLGNNRRRWFLGVAVAAVLALLLMLGGRLFAPVGNAYEQFAQHQPLSLTERGVDNTATAAETAFNEGRYAEAIDRLKGYLEVQKDDQRALLALGIALLERNQDTAAVEIFTDIAGSNTPLAPYGNWYLALAAVKQGDNAEALRFLEQIPASDAYLTERVRKLKATL